MKNRLAYFRLVRKNAKSLFRSIAEAGCAILLGLFFLFVFCAIGHTLRPLIPTISLLCFGFISLFAFSNWKTGLMLIAGIALYLISLSHQSGPLNFRWLLFLLGVMLWLISVLCGFKFEYVEPWKRENKK